MGRWPSLAEGGCLENNRFRKGSGGSNPSLPAYYLGEKMVTALDIVDLRLALIMTLPRCHVCGDFAVWEWYDEDGSETVCDEHISRHFYRNGPYELDEVRNAIAVLERTA